jgi:ribosomal protein S18 acetylase RimI-like enzyme
VVDEQVAGFCLARRDERRVQAINVRPSLHGRGLGSMLLEAALAWLGTDGDIVLNVVSYNDKAIRFYERHGFVRSGRAGHSAITLPNGLTLPEIEMVRPART